MVIQPFNYQKRTNIEEHNQIVDKLNEVVDAVNNIDPSGQGLEPRVTALETDVTDLGTRVDSVESKNTQQDTEISNIKADAETTKNRLGTAEGNITTLTGKVGQLETDTTNLDGRVTDIDGRLTTLAGNYTTLGGRVDSLDSQVGQLNTEIGGLETGKVNADQGVANAGKVLGIGSDGRVTPVEQSGGGGGATFPYAESFNNITGSELGTKLKAGDILVMNFSYRNANGTISSPTLETKGDFKTINGSISFGPQVIKDRLSSAIVTKVSNGVVEFAEEPIRLHQYNDTVSANGVTLKCTTIAQARVKSLGANGVLFTETNAYFVCYSDDVSVLPRSNNFSSSVTESEGFNGYIIHNS